jgi:inner membrane protein
LPTILTHPAVPLALGLGLGQSAISRRLLVAGIAASILPDLDVVAFGLDIPYTHDFGHRGFSHSLFFAAMVALVGACCCRALHTTFGRAVWFLFVATASHGVLDAFTNGGLGIAFLWPWSGERYFAPFRMIEVSPISIRQFLSHWGARVVWSELAWVWGPCTVLAGTLLWVRGAQAPRRGR